MKLLLDTSTSICRVTLIDGDDKYHYEWSAGRELAKGLLKYLFDLLAEHHKTWSDISGIGVFEGPGSFTGLRIGMTVVNTLADSLAVPIVAGRGDDWQAVIVDKLDKGQDEKIALPFYGADANITTPKK